MSNGYTLFAVVIWTLGWLATTYTAVSRTVAHSRGSALLGAGIGLVMTTLGCCLIGGLLRSGCDLPRSSSVVPLEQRTVRQPWSRRLMSLYAATFFVFFAVAWNVGFMGWLIQTAADGPDWWMLVLIPFSLLGLLLLIGLFNGIGVCLASLLTGLKRLATWRKSGDKCNGP
jgi:hypothetical protein